MRKSTSGFTIVELLIVIVVIAILAAISVVAYSNVRMRAQASAIASELKAAEKAFNSFKIATGASSWWAETDSALLAGGGGTIPSIIANNAEFRNFLQKAPTTDGLGTTLPWTYDNDGDTYNGCSTSTGGVNLYVYNVTNLDLVQALDNAIDDGNLSCGKMRFNTSNNNILFNLAPIAN